MESHGGLWKARKFRRKRPNRLTTTIRFRRPGRAGIVQGIPLLGCADARCAGCLRQTDSGGGRRSDGHETIRPRVLLWLSLVSKNQCRQARPCGLLDKERRGESSAKLDMLVP